MHHPGMERRSGFQGAAGHRLSRSQQRAVRAQPMGPWPFWLAFSSGDDCNAYDFWQLCSLPADVAAT
eukprot:7390065-Prymnesium_polylepis.3